MAAAASHWLIASALLFCALVGAAPAPDASAEEPSGLVGYKASVLHFIADPWDLAREGACSRDFAHQETCDHLAVEYFEEGLLVVTPSGHVHALGDYKDLHARFPDIAVVNYTNSILLPGFIDCHTHFPQLDSIASWGDTLSEWLENYIYPEESQYVDPRVARKSARRFTNDLLRAGTTTANVYNVIFEDGVDALFEEAAAKNMRLISGLNGMADCRGAYRFNTTEGEEVPLCNSEDPDDTLGIESASIIRESSERLIQKWHNKKGNRLIYSLMPRFLTTATPASLEVYAELLAEAPPSPEGLEVRFHTHVNENLELSLDSIAGFQKLAMEYYNTEGSRAFLEKILNAKTQLEIFELYGLVNQNASFAHNIHLTYRDYEVMRQGVPLNETLPIPEKGMNFHRPSSCHCPTSNLFLGSGLFDMKSHIEYDVPFGIGTDVGGGTSYSLLRTLGEVYKVSMLGALEAGNELTAQDKPMYPGGEEVGEDGSLDKYFFPVKESYRLSPLKQIYLITLGTAKQLGLENFVGNFQQGKEADFVVIDKESTPWVRQRLKDITQKYAKKAEAGPLSRAQLLNEVGEKLLAVSTLSSDSVVKATYVLGTCQYLREVDMELDIESDYRAEIVAAAAGAYVYDRKHGF